ncbi:MAG: GAF domain-containing protein [Planctomycetota bacterium]|nr:MAG: GAF domain-containing protein [Planctomycetota bacterium]
MPSDIDLQLCEQEPIHALGSIQAHGYLVAAEASSGRIAWASANLDQALGIDAHQLVGQPMARLVDFGLPTVPATLGQQAYYQRFHRKNAGTDENQGPGWDLWMHSHAGLIFWEWETPPADHPSLEDLSPDRPWSQAMAQQVPLTLYRAADLLARECAAISAFDRVMVYRFLPDWCGEVIAETRSDDRLLPFLGLRYPASDIPPQARRLYVKNRCRMIIDVHGKQASLIGFPGAAAPDCSFCRLRSVSPYHLEYLHNMGVAATVAYSLLLPATVVPDQALDHDHLWGMVVLHHGRSQRLSPERQRQLDDLCSRWQAWLVEHQQQDLQQAQNRRQRDQRHIAKALTHGGQSRALRQLIVGDLVLPRLFSATGAALLIDGGMIRMGECPSPASLQNLAAHLRQQIGICGVWHCNSLNDDLGLLNDAPGLCGILAGICSTPSAITILCFRGEVSRDVYWGGDPATPAEVDQQQRLRPRKSFDLWRESVRGQSAPWEEHLLERMDDVIHGLESLAGADDSSTLLRQLRQLLRLNSRGIEVLDLALRGSSDGVAIVSDESDSPRVSARPAAAQQLAYANGMLFELFGADPLTTQLSELQALISAAGIDLGYLHPGAQSLDAWTSLHGQRRLLCEQSHALSILCDGQQRSWQALHLRDVTLDHRVMQAMTAARDQARHAQSVQRALLANVSHEMRTPLNAIIGFSDILNDGATWEDAQQRSEYLSYIQDGGKYLLHLITNILDIAALQGGRMALGADEMIDLNALVHEVQAWLDTYARQHEVSISGSSLGATPHWLYGDRQRLRQVFINLMANGIKYNRANGILNWQISADPSGDLLISFRDSGIGIAEADLPNIFDPFTRVSSAETLGREGTGLGLSISRALVELHGGSLSVRSEVGRGSTFTVSLPQTRLCAPPAAKTETP